MRIGLFGFPRTGKSTLFHLLTGIGAGASHGRGDRGIGVCRVPDPRLEKLAAMYSPRKTTPATIEYLDLAGVEKGQAAKVLPLDQLRTVDALAHVVRAYEDEANPPADDSVDPPTDVETMETEFLLADHTIAERRIERLELQVKKAHQEDDRKELELMRKVLRTLEGETPLRNVPWDETEERALRGFTFLSLKPLLVVVNAAESTAARLGAGPAAFGLGEIATRPRTEVVALSAKIEAEIAQLDASDAAAFMRDLGIEEPALDRLIRASYRLLGCLSFFTVGEDECRAWTIREGTTARRAAGTIHSDIERGFIRAELVAYDDLVAAGSWAACRSNATLRLEGKDYVMRDGDVVNFRFNV